MTTGLYMKKAVQERMIFPIKKVTFVIGKCNKKIQSVRSLPIGIGPTYLTSNTHCNSEPTKRVRKTGFVFGTKCLVRLIFILARSFVRSLAHSHWKPNWVSLNLCSQTAKKWRCHFRPKINRYIQKQLKGQMLADISYDLLWSLIKGHRLLVSGLCVNALGISCVVAVIVLKGKCNFWNIELYLTIKLASWVLKSQRLHKTLTSGLCFS